MMYKVGDRVKFLNEKGGGIITKVISPTLVKVAIEEGFEVPTLASDLVKVEVNEFSQRFFKENSQEIAAGADEDNVAPDLETLSPLLAIAGRKSPAQGVYLAFIPHSQKWLITGKLDLYIFNHTDYDVLYSYILSNSDASFSGMDHDVIPPHTRIYLQTLEREEIRDWNKGILQLLFYREESRKVMLPASVSFTISESRFSKEDNYSSINLVDSRVLLYNVVEISKHGSLTARTLDPKYGHRETLTEKANPYKEVPFIENHKTAEGEAEVDLHIESLVDDIKGLDVGRILDIQLDYFSRCLESAISGKYHKVIFIHGIGNGTLKTEIKSILDDYQGLEHHPASMARFGSGAIEVTIFHNR